MNKRKQYLIVFYIFLISVVNLNYYSYYGIINGNTLQSDRVMAYSVLESQDTNHFSVIDKPSNLQYCIDRFQKQTVKLTLPEWNFLKLSFFNNRLNNRIATFLFSYDITPNFPGFDIIYPFHSFW
jgi:hypothetical protein